jgi:hypothetical protein
MNFNTIIKDLDDLPITRFVGNNEIEMDVRYVIRQALISPPAQAIDQISSLQRYDLNNVVSTADEKTIFSAEDKVLIKQCVSLIYGPLVLGQIVDLIDPRSK